MESWDLRGIQALGFWNFPNNLMAFNRMSGLKSWSARMRSGVRYFWMNWIFLGWKVWGLPKVLRRISGVEWKSKK